MAASAGDNRKELEWVVKAKKGSRVDVTVSSERAGTDTAALVLE
jgi:hypothetical protein